METNNKARREAALLMFVVFLLGTLLGGVGNHLWAERVHGQQLAPSKGAPTRGQVVSGMTHTLELTPDQQKQLETIMDDTRSKMQALYVPLDAQKEQIRQEGRANIRAILTPGQQPKFDDFLHRLDEQRKKDAVH